MSKELKHTKTEWIIEDNYIVSQNKCVATLPLNHADFEANSKLIVMAPQLLEALIKTKESIIELSECEDFFPQWAKVLLHTRLCEIETAINKATS